MINCWVILQINQNQIGENVLFSHKPINIYFNNRLFNSILIEYSKCIDNIFQIKIYKIPPGHAVGVQNDLYSGILNQYYIIISY